MSRPRLAFIGDPAAAPVWLLQAIATTGVFEAICNESDLRSDAAACAARWTFQDPTAMLREAEPDGVIICVPFDRRLRLTRQCLTARAGVLTVGPAGSPAGIRRAALIAKLVRR